MDRTGLSDLFLHCAPTVEVLARRPEHSACPESARLYEVLEAHQRALDEIRTQHTADVLALTNELAQLRQELLAPEPYLAIDAFVEGRPSTIIPPKPSLWQQFRLLFWGKP